VRSIPGSRRDHSHSTMQNVRVDRWFPAIQRAAFLEQHSLTIVALSTGQPSPDGVSRQWLREEYFSSPSWNIFAHFQVMTSSEGRR
jgi:hypothetical protein